MPRLPALEEPLQPATQTSPARPLQARLTHLRALLGLVQPVPRAWLVGAARGLKSHATSSGGEETTIRLKSCESYQDLVKAWRKALKWSPGLDNTLAVMLASSFSTQFVGEQLWLKVIGPPSCGKTTLMEGLATARKWYLSKDTIRGFHSGWKREDNADVSLADMVKGMTLGTKDGDTLLKAPNLKQILAEARALYDRVSRTNYRNDTNREYQGHRMTWHLAGTNALREIDDSELGVRFLDVVVMDKIDDEFEYEVCWRAVNQEMINMRHLSDGKPETQYPEDLANAMALSGGYLDFLRTNAVELARSLELSDESVVNRCIQLGIFTAFMRARSGANSEEATREFGPRLTTQLGRLATGLACVFNKPRVDDEVMHKTWQVAMHTSRGPTLELVKVLHKIPQGIEVRGLAALMRANDDKLRAQLRFLRAIGVVETDVNFKRWRITPKLSKLYEAVNAQRS